MKLGRVAIQRFNYLGAWSGFSRSEFFSLLLPFHMLSVSRIFSPYNFLFLYPPVIDNDRSVILQGSLLAAELITAYDLINFERRSIGSRA